MENLNDAPLWLIVLLSIVAGSICVFLGMAGSALQIWANNYPRDKKE